MQLQELCDCLNELVSILAHQRRCDHQRQFDFSIFNSQGSLAPRSAIRSPYEQIQDLVKPAGNKLAQLLAQQCAFCHIMSAPSYNLCVEHAPQLAKASPSTQSAQTGARSACRLVEPVQAACVTLARSKDATCSV